MASLAAPLLVRGLPSILGSQIEPSFRGPVLLFVVAVAVLCSLLCGVVPAWHRTQPGWFNALQESGRTGGASAASTRARSSLVVAQIALCLLLLAGAGLLLSSLQALQRVDTGFDPRDLLTANYSLPKSVYNTDEKLAAFMNALEESAERHSRRQQRRALRCVALHQQWRLLQLQHQGATDGAQPARTARRHSPGVARLFLHHAHSGADGTHLQLSGDRQGTQLVAVVDDVLARQYWPGENPVGQYIGFDPKNGATGTRLWAS